jgi:hypothetical protein
MKVAMQVAMQVSASLAYRDVPVSVGPALQTVRLSC